MGKQEDIEVNEDQVIEPSNNDGLIIIHEDHIVSREDSFVEQDEDDLETDKNGPETDEDELSIPTEEV